MKLSHFQHLTCAAISLVCSNAVWSKPDVSWGLAPYLPPVLPAPGPDALIWYGTSVIWLVPPQLGQTAQTTAKTAKVETAETAAGPAALLNYCVFPAIQIKPRPPGTTREPWNRSFDIALVNRDGTPAAPTFRPVTVPTPIRVNSFQILEPTPVWCATLSGMRAPPEIYLQVEDRRVRVEFPRSWPGPAVPLPPAAPAPSPAAASVPR
jgi:hypothetical protein